MWPDWPDDKCAELPKIARHRPANEQSKLARHCFGKVIASDYVHCLTNGTMKAYKLLPNGRSQIIRFTIAGEIMASTCISAHIAIALRPLLIAPF